MKWLPKRRFFFYLLLTLNETEMCLKIISSSSLHRDVVGMCLNVQMWLLILMLTVSRVSIKIIFNRLHKRWFSICLYFLCESQVIFYITFARGLKACIVEYQLSRLMKCLTSSILSKNKAELNLCTKQCKLLRRSDFTTSKTDAILALWAWISLN